MQSSAETSTEAPSGPPPPLPSAPVGDAVLITVDRAKLMPDIAALLDSAAAGALPPGAQFFEKRITVAGLLSKLLWAAGFSVVGVLCVIFGVAEVIHPAGQVTVYSTTDWLPLGFGLVCLLAAWMMVTSWLKSLRLRDTQRAGRRTTVGIFLTPGTLIEATDSSWCIIPRSAFRGLDGRSVKYDVNGQGKSFALPAEVVGHDPQEIVRAIQAWAQ